nr:helix-turn-helix transcriptional regulator [Shimia aestuarii]
MRSARQVELVRFLTEARITAGLTQSELAEKIGEHQSFIARLESGQRRIDVVEVVALAEAIGFDLHAMIDHVKAAQG